MIVDRSPAARDGVDVRAGANRVGGWLFVLALSAPVSDADHGFSQQFAFSLDFRWLYLFYLRVLPRSAVFALTLTFVAWVSFCAWRLCEAMRRVPRPT